MFKPNVGLIGIGKWGNILREKLKKHSNLIFTANSKTNYKKRIKQVDWIFVATPDKTHFKIIKELLNYNKNIFCEKPLTLSYKQSKELYKLAKTKKVKLYVDDIQTFYQKKIVLKKDNFIERKKKGIGDPKNLLYRFAYHDFYFLENKLKSKIKSIIIKDVKKNLQFQINYYNNLSFNFDYSLNSEKKVHRINNTNFITKRDLLSCMIYKVLKNKVNFEKNMRISLFSNRLIDKITKKF